jgi:hypothetical protein
MNNLFYKEKEQNREDFGEDLGFDFLDSVEMQGKDNSVRNVNIMKYLHGYCDVFAYRLHEKYGYDIQLDYEDEQCTRLIHAYCVIEVDGRTLYIDCRGICDDFDTFIEEFTDWDCYGNMNSAEPEFVDESKKFLCRTGEFSKLHREIDFIMSDFEKEYDTRYFYKNKI